MSRAPLFNTAGPCVPEDHYMLPPEPRLIGVRMLIERKQYFVLHAPRQTGKTTALLALAERLTDEGRYAAVLVSAETGQPFGDDAGAAELAILEGWAADARTRLPMEAQL